MNSTQLKLASELMEEFEQGKHPKFDFFSAGQWATCDKADALHRAISYGLSIRRHDPYRHLKDALEEGKRVRIGTQPWRSKGASEFSWRLPPEDYEIEPDWRLPDPPLGRQWNNATKWTREMLPDGYRPQLVGEAVEGEFSQDDGQSWICDNYPARPIIHDVSSVIYRTKQPLPPPKKRVPLCQTDIPWNARLRGKGWISGCSASFSVCGYGVEFMWNGTERLNWNELGGYEYSTDGVTWHPFSKEVEA